MMSEIEDGLYIGDMDDAKNCSDSIVHVVTVAEPKLGSTTVYCPLVDGKNEQEDFDAAVDAVKGVIRDDDGDVLVHCRLGVSRSPTVVATALADLRDESLQFGLDVVLDSRSINPAHELLVHGREYLDEEYMFQGKKVD